ncbi:putative lipid phosphate phosphatase YodM [Enterococcus florum]|uniref:Putative lipid phosphate phosphatase YodM n=1 Tax=Enterococcus florum TaxID=2480627 RepID=A0A4P5P8N1_9ENTE|nr:phosphatase PAP2 family protein [Enterococcus florum]GCF94377.1 putative lipid phosphate phosphatase YodM [Enterococcus florum]
MFTGAVVFFAGFLLVMVLVKGKRIQTWDVAFSRKVILQRKVWLTKVFLFFTRAGKALPTLAVCGLLIVVPLTRNTVALNVGISVMATSGLVFLIKRLYKRERPKGDRLVEETDHSFPSGHAATAVTLYGSLFLNGYLVLGISIWFLSAALLLGFLIGFSRVYLGVHYFTDVLGGWFIGGFVAILVALWMV